MTDPAYITIRLLREDAEAIAGDLHRASLAAVLRADDESQGIASDLNALLDIVNGALGNHELVSAR